MQQNRLLFCLVVFFQIFSLFLLQEIEVRRYRPITENKCDRHGRCSPKEGYIEEKFDEDDYKSEKDRPPILGRDDWPVRTGDDNYKPKEDVNKDDDLKSARPTGGSGYGGGYNPKPSVDEKDNKPVETDSSDSLKPSGGGRISSGGYGGGYKPKPSPDDDEDLKPVRPTGGGGTGYGGGYLPKPVDRDEDLKPAGGVRPSSSGYIPKPVPDRDDDVDLKPARPTGGSYGGGYRPKPLDRDDDLKPPRGRPGSGYGYNTKPVTDRDEDSKLDAGSDYNRKPPRDSVDYSKEDGGRDRYGGGYYPKPGGSRLNYPKYEDDDYSIKPTRAESGYRPNEDRNHNKEDLGGYNKPKSDDYNDDYGDKDDDYDGGSKSRPFTDNSCICVPYYQCRDGQIVTDGAGIIDARKRPEPDEEIPLDGKYVPPACGPFHVCCNTPETSTVKPYEHRCGVRNPSGINSRILAPSNKGEADFGEWPWQAAVLKEEGAANIFQCGAVLIDKYHVLTVAHCVFHLYKYNEYPLKVRLGEWDTQSTKEFLAHEDYKVSKIIIHPEFRNASLWNDIAVLRLQEPVLFAPHIDTVCLPQYDEFFSGQNCVVTGWGKDAYKGGTFSNVMKEVALQVIDNYQCEEMLRKTRLGRFFQLHEGFACAGGEYGLDSCKGDGGGPLVCYRKDKSYALVGLVSWGIDCGQPGVPGVYVKIQKYLNWISKTTGMNLQDYWPKK